MGLLLIVKFAFQWTESKTRNFSWKCIIFTGINCLISISLCVIRICPNVYIISRLELMVWTVLNKVAQHCLSLHNNFQYRSLTFFFCLPPLLQKIFWSTYVSNLQCALTLLLQTLFAVKHTGFTIMAEVTNSDESKQKVLNKTSMRLLTSEMVLNQLPWKFKEDQVWVQTLHPMAVQKLFRWRPIVFVSALPYQKHQSQLCGSTFSHSVRRCIVLCPQFLSFLALMTFWRSDLMKNLSRVAFWIRAILTRASKERANPHVKALTK